MPNRLRIQLAISPHPRILQQQQQNPSPPQLTPSSTPNSSIISQNHPTRLPTLKCSTLRSLWTTTLSSTTRATPRGATPKGKPWPTLLLRPPLSQCRTRLLCQLSSRFRIQRRHPPLNRLLTLLQRQPRNRLRTLRQPQPRNPISSITVCIHPKQLRSRLNTMEWRNRRVQLRTQLLCLLRNLPRITKVMRLNRGWLRAQGRATPTPTLTTSPLPTVRRSRLIRANSSLEM